MLDLKKIIHPAVFKKLPSPLSISHIKIGFWFKVKAGAMFNPQAY
jgi:hypothetical protein